MNAPRYKQSTRHQGIIGLRRLLRSLTAHGAPHGLEDSAPRIPAPAPRPDTVALDDLNTLLALAPPHLKLYLLLCHDCALRANTALRVGWHNLQDDDVIAMVTKFGAVVRVPISGRIRELLRQCPKGNAPWVALLRGRPVAYPTINAQLHALLATAGAPRGTRSHDLRRTMAERTYALTADLRVVQTLLGHGKLHSTLHYLQRPAARQMEALAASTEAITNPVHAPLPGGLTQ